MLIVNGLEVDRGGAHILDGLSLSAKKGQVVLLTGRNGSGKSTALLAIAGRLPILSGTIEWTDGPKPVGERRRPRCGLLLQGGRVFPSMKVRENLEIAGMGLPPAVFAKRLETLFTQLPQ